jgi:hypothetical protein
MSFTEIGTSDGMFLAQNSEIFVQQCPKQSNVFSGNEFPQIWDIRQNVFTETLALMFPKRANVFSGNEFCRNRDIVAWLKLAQRDPMSLQKSIQKIKN